MILNVISKTCQYCRHQWLLMDDYSADFVRSEAVAVAFFFDFYGHLERCRELDEMAKYYMNKGLEN